MDRVEFGIKLEQIQKLQAKSEYAAAAGVADTIDWRKVRKWSELSVAEEVYEQTGRYKEARNICVYAYNRNLGGKRLLYKLTELSILINDLEEADDLYKEFVETAPRDMERYILLYKLNKARGVQTDRLIEILEEYKQNELDEQYEFELAQLYADAGRIDECVQECDDLILWFNDGDYVEKALRLKEKHAPLTERQRKKLRSIEEHRAAGIEYKAVLPDYELEDTEKESTESEIQSTDSEEELKAGEEYIEVIQDNSSPEPVSLTEEDEITVPEKDYTIYDTQNIQEALAKSMETILAGMQEKSEAPVITAPEVEAPEIIKAGNSSKDTMGFAVEEADADIIDEPTKELRINTHHWKRVSSVMVEDETPTEKPVSGEDNLPKYLVTESVTEGEAEALNPYTIEQVETVIQGEEPVTEVTEEPEETVTEAAEELKAEEAEEADIEPEAEEPAEEADIEPEAEDNTEEPEEEDSAEDMSKDTPTESAANVPVKAEEQIILKNPTQMEIGEVETIDGQMDIMEWLNSVESGTEEISATAENEPVDDKDESLKSDAELEAVETAMNEMTAMLIEQVNSDLAEKEKNAVPTAVSEEEYISADESGEEEEIELTEVGEDDESEAGDFEEDEEEEDVRNDYVLKPAERKYLKKHLFISGLEGSVAQVINSKKRETADGTSSFGNICILGKRNTDKTGFAINLFKALHADDEKRDLKIAKTTATMLNEKGIASNIDKMRGSTLIIENAGALSKEVVSELYEFMIGNTDSMLVILTGEDFAIKKLFSEYPSFAKLFDYSIEIRHYTVNELVSIAKEYARVKGYRIEEKALFRLYMRIGEIEGDDSGSEMEKVRAIVDGAIQKKGEKGKKAYAKHGTLIALKEKDFIK
ncbi:MAG: tetratricopeptide repeat protein [Butyrivibrio sp.]